VKLYFIFNASLFSIKICFLAKHWIHCSQSIYTFRCSIFPAASFCGKIGISNREISQIE
jgi:hypothetical protein